MMTLRGSKNQSILLRIAPTTPHCGHFTTVIITIYNPRSRATFAYVMFMSKSTFHEEGPARGFCFALRGGQW